MSDRCPICAGVISAESSSCPSCGHELVERARVGANKPEADELTTESLLAAPAVYRKLLEPDPLSPLWTETDDPLAMPIPTRERGRDRWKPAVVAAVVAFIAIFGIIRLFSGNDEPTAQVLGVTAETTPAATSTLLATTTTTTSTTTTTVPPTTTLPPPTVKAIGDPIPQSDLRLGAFGLRPFDFGDPWSRVLGRLAASLDEPSEVTFKATSGGELGTCLGDEYQTARWGRLVVIGVENGDGEMVFAGYRLDESYDTLAYPPVRTISRLGLGDTVGTLESTYPRVRYVDDAELGPVYQVVGGDGSLLLWGPVTSTGSTGEVTGIYSPNSCGAFS